MILPATSKISVKPLPDRREESNAAKADMNSDCGMKECLRLSLSKKSSLLYYPCTYSFSRWDVCKNLSYGYARRIPAAYYHFVFFIKNVPHHIYFYYLSTHIIYVFFTRLQYFYSTQSFIPLVYRWSLISHPWWDWAELFLSLSHFFFIIIQCILYTHHHHHIAGGKSRKNKEFFYKRDC